MGGWGLGIFYLQMGGRNNGHFQRCWWRMREVAREWVGVARLPGWGNGRVMSHVVGFFGCCAI